MQAALRGGGNPGSHPRTRSGSPHPCGDFGRVLVRPAHHLNNLPPLLVQIPNKYFVKWIFIWYLQVNECWFFCPAEQVPMQCSSPMPFITTYVGFNCCRSIRGNTVHYKLCGFYTNSFLNCGYSVSLNKLRRLTTMLLGAAEYKGVWG